MARVKTIRTRVCEKNLASTTCNNRELVLILAIAGILSFRCGLAADLDSVKPARENESDDTSHESTSTEDTSCSVLGCDSEGLSHCDEDSGTCVACLTDGHCTMGFGCNTAKKECYTDCKAPFTGCAAEYYCDFDTCLPKKASGESCTDGKNYECKDNHCENLFCCPSGTCCNSGENCSPDTPICSPKNSCVACSDVSAPPDACAALDASKPLCEIAKSQCVECLSHSDCFIDKDAGVDIDRPYLSPIGVCTPDNTCTCWVPRDDPTTGCLACPPSLGDDFVCARDYDDTIANVHTVCLRKCRDESPGDPIDGLMCGNPPGGSNFLWLPPTTCFGFSGFIRGTTLCSKDVECSIYGTDAKIAIDDDAVCKNEKCSYRCQKDDRWCPIVDDAKTSCHSLDNYCSLDN